MCLFLCQYHTVWITIALEYSLKIGNVMILALFFSLKIVLAFGGSFVVPYKFVDCFISVKKCHWNFDRNCICRLLWVV